MGFFFGRYVTQPRSGAISATPGARKSTNATDNPVVVIAGLTKEEQIIRGLFKKLGISEWGGCDIQTNDREAIVKRNRLSFVRNMAWLKLVPNEKGPTRLPSITCTHSSHGDCEIKIFDLMDLVRVYCIASGIVFKPELTFVDVQMGQHSQFLKKKYQKPNDKKQSIH